MYLSRVEDNLPHCCFNYDCFSPEPVAYASKATSDIAILCFLVVPWHAHPFQLITGDVIELTKFINQANEIKAATAACKEGTQLRIVKPPPSDAMGASKKK
eukprot:Gb_17455 [translate_table: standard]